MKNSSKSISARLLSVALLGVLSIGVVAPLQLAAQDQSALPTQPDTKPATESPKKANPGLGSELAPGQVKKEEAEDENVYRHTALVQTLARTFHMDVETTARLFEWINFAIIALCIVLPIVKFLPRVIRQRSQGLKHRLEEARKTTADANTRLSAVEAQLSRLDDEIAKIRTQVEADSRQDEQRIKASIEEERARIVASAEQEITMAAAQARRGLRTYAADLAIEQAASQLTLTPETDRALISEFVREAGNGMARGGHK